MTQLLIDPSLRRARLVRGAFVTILVAVLATLVVFARGLHAEPRRPLSLARPPRALPSGARRARLQRPESGQRRPESGQRRPESGQRPVEGGRRSHSQKEETVNTPPPDEPLEVIAFFDPRAKGASVSLDRHADVISTVAAVGLLVGDGGAIIDRLDETALDVARSHQLRIVGVVQNLDESDGSWRGDRVAALGHDAVARGRLAAELQRACEAHQLDGVNLDLEEIDERDWPGLLRVVEEVSRRLSPLAFEVSIDVPARLDERWMARLGQTVDRVVVMAYDELDPDGPPGPIASEAFVDGALVAARVVPPGKRVAGLGVYGYDWIKGRPAESINFVDAQAVAKEAKERPRWDRASGNLRFRYADDQGEHEVWMLDASTLWNQVALARARGVGAVALWLLGGEDPGVWDALAAAATGEVPALSAVPSEDRVETVGGGPFLSLSLSPEAGRRALTVEHERIVDERWETLPSPYLVRRAGIVPGKVALTFDDGPDPRYTPAILDVLRRAGAPATFFLIGANAGREPELVRRELAEGHELGNHSYTHPDVDRVSDGRLRLELEATSRLLETLVGRRPLLYRPPAMADVEPRTVESAAAFARAGSLGYLVVDADVDPRDWAVPSATELTRRVLDEADKGGVILLHDAGGDRSATVEALPRIIDGLRSRGLSIVPLSELVGRSRDEVMPEAGAREPVVAVANHAVFRGAASSVRFGGLCLAAGLVLVSLRAALLLVLAAISERRRRVAPRRSPLCSATVVIPAYNEEGVIERTVSAVLESDVPVSVLVVDDGSTDRTRQIVAERFAYDLRVQLLSMPNGGKAAALRRGFCVADTEVVVALDGDTLFARDTVRELLAPFCDPRVGAVAGTAEVGNVVNGLTACQALEYLVQQALERRAWDALRALPVVPGAVGAWRRSAVAEVGGFSSETLAEDADLSMALCRAGWRVVYAPKARARTEAPETVAALCKQRVRWTFGTFQAMWKHRGALIERRAGRFGRVVFPSLLVFQVLLALLAPAASLAVLAALLAKNVAPALLTSAVLFGAEGVQAAAAIRYARRDGIDGMRLLPWLLLGRFFYRPLLLAVMARSLGRVLDGIPLGWGKLARRGGWMAGGQQARARVPLR